MLCGVHSDMMKSMQATDLPSRLLLDSMVCLLRALVVGVAVHCHVLSPRLTRAVTSLLHHLVSCGTTRGSLFVCLVVWVSCLFVTYIILYMYIASNEGTFWSKKRWNVWGFFSI